MTVAAERQRQTDGRFFSVTTMEASLRFYVDGLGFKKPTKWIRWALEHRFISCAKMRWRSIANSNQVEFRRGNVHSKPSLGSAAH